MRHLKILRVPFLLIFLVAPSALFGQSRSLISEMSDLAWAEEVDGARALLESKRADGEQPTPEWLAAVSWMARGASFAERWDLAERYASEAYEGSLALLKERPLDAERFLPTALGAGIEVLGHNLRRPRRPRPGCQFSQCRAARVCGHVDRNSNSEELPFAQLGGEAVSCSRGR